MTGSNSWRSRTAAATPPALITTGRSHTAPSGCGTTRSNGRSILDAWRPIGSRTRTAPTSRSLMQPTTWRPCPSPMTSTSATAAARPPYGFGKATGAGPPWNGHTKAAEAPQLGPSAAEKRPAHAGQFLALMLANGSDKQKTPSPWGVARGLAGFPDTGDRCRTRLIRLPLSIPLGQHAYLQGSPAPVQRRGCRFRARRLGRGGRRDSRVSSPPRPTARSRRQ